MRSLFRLCSACALWALASASTLTPEQIRLNVESFDYVWKTVGDKHWDPKLGGTNWQAVRDDLRPQIQKAATMSSARKILSEMLSRLRLTHYGIIPADIYSSLPSEETERKYPEGSTGLDLRISGNDALVTSVDAGSPAEKAGIRPGWLVRKAGNAQIPQVISKLKAAYAHSTLLQLMGERAILALVEGAHGPVAFVDASGNTVERQIGRGSPRGNVTKFGFLPPVHVWIDSKQIANTGYTRFNMFLDPAHLMPAFASAVQGCLACDGFIIDLRGNPGGLGAMAMGMAGFFVNQKDRYLGTMYMRDNTIKFVVFPRPRTYDGPLAILVDGASASTSEIFAGGLRDLGRARIFGTHTAAAALPSVIETLPNGDGFQYAIANYISEGGKPLEGIGLEPDVVAVPSREALLAGKDPALDAALEWIRHEKH